MRRKEPENARFASIPILLLLSVVARAQPAQLTNLPAPVVHVGQVVAGIGDVDGDGRADFLESVYTVTGSLGEVRVYSGATGARIHQLETATAGTEFGRTLLGTSDLDGDGVADFAIGEPKAGPGAVHVHSGATAALLYTVTGAATMQSFGYALAEVGDVDGDAIADLAIGAPGQVLGSFGFTGFAAVSVVSGASGSVLTTFPTTSTTLVDGFGTAVAGPGDLNGDGVPDIAVGVPTIAVTPPSVPPQSARVEIYSGANGSLLATWVGSNPTEHFGAALAAVGDVNGDGVGDVAVGADNAAPAGSSAVGRVDMVSGSSGAALWSVAGAMTNERLGERVVAAGDANGDGVGEVLVGSTLTRLVVMLSGANGSVLGSFGGAQNLFGFGRVFGATGDADQDGVADIVVSGAGEWGENGVVFLLSGATFTVIQAVYGNSLADSFGFALAAAGDLDGDLVIDILVGAPEANGNAVVNSGSVVAFSGADGSVLAAIPGTTPLESLGFAVDGGSDLDGDGVAEILAGAPDPLRRTAPINPGRALVISGATGATLQTFTGTQPGSKLGFAVAFLDDVDGDGIDDIVLGEPGDLTVATAGLVRVHSGATGALLYTRPGAAPGDRLGFGVARLGDVDGDGVGDFLAGAPRGGPLFSFALPAFKSAFGAGYVDVCSGATGALIRSHPGTVVSFGRVVRGCPDFDGDGVSDYAIGAPYAFSGMGTGTGSVDVHSGASGALLYTLSGGPGDSLGAAIAPGADLDGDGIADLAVGAPDHGSRSGSVEVYSGASGQRIFRGDSPVPPQYYGGEQYGQALAWIGDLGNDVAPVLAVGAPSSLYNFAAPGRVALLRPRVQPLPVQPPTVFGTGCPLPASLGPLTISAPSTPQSTGSPNFSVLLGFAPPGSVATLLIGFSNTTWLGNALPLNLAPAGLPGCQLLVSLDAMLPGSLSFSSGLFDSFFVPLPVSPNGALSGAVFYCQWFVQDPGTVSGLPGAGVSAGLMVTIQ